MSKTSWIAAAAVCCALGQGCGGGGGGGAPAASERDLTTWAGTGLAGFDGDGRPPASSRLYWPVDVTFTASGATYILDWNNHRVRTIDASGNLQTVIGTDFVGDGPPGATDLTAPGADGTTVDLNHPTQFVEIPGADGDLMLWSWHNHKLRRFDAATGKVVVITGRGGGFAGDGLQASDPTTRVNQPAGGTIAPDGTIYILDQRNQRIRRIDTSGVISTVAGTGTAGFTDNVAPLSAQFNFPTGTNPPPAGTLVLDGQGRLYVSDTLNHRIRRIDFAGTVTTIAGNGTAAFAGDGGQATSASLNNPRDIEFGPDGRLYVADELNHRIRAIDLTTGVITTVVGNGTGGYSGDGGPPLEASLFQPAGVAFDKNGILYVSDTFNNRIRRVRL